MHYCYCKHCEAINFKTYISIKHLPGPNMKRKRKSENANFCFRNGFIIHCFMGKRHSKDVNGFHPILPWYLYHRTLGLTQPVLAQFEVFFMILGNYPTTKCESNPLITSITLFLGGLPRFLLNMASMLVVMVMEMGSIPFCVMFHFLVYSWIL